jgi:hypothetical protein
MKVKLGAKLSGVAASAGSDVLTDESEQKHTCWDPKDGELCLNRVKPEETLVEARSDSDVQIDRQIWV